MTTTANLTTCDYWDQQWQNVGKVRILSSRHWFYGRNGVFLRMLRSHLQRTDNLSVIELGGGHSYRLLCLAKWLAAQVTAVDYSGAGLKMTETLFAANGCSLDLVHADFFDWDAGDKKYDLVVHWGLMEHFTNPLPLLELGARLLKPGGALIFSMPNMRARSSAMWEHWSPANWKLHIYHSDEILANAFATAGLKLERAFHFGAPLIQFAPWEKPGLLPSLMSKVQLGLMAVAKVLPVYHRSSSWWATERGYFLTLM